VSSAEFGRSWTTATFPSEDLRHEFLHQVRLWNGVDGLPPIEVETPAHRLRLRLRYLAGNPARFLQLLAAYDGRVPLTDPD
jgi:hypothetical protein